MTTLEEALAAARQSVLVVDDTQAFGVLLVRGGDRLTWLNGLVSCDMTKLGPGRGLYGLAVTPKGRVLADLVFIEAGEHVIVVLAMSQVAAVASAFDHYLVMEDAELEAAAEAYRVLSVHGPKSAAVLVAAKEAGAVVAQIDRYGLGGGGLVVASCATFDAVKEAVEGASSAQGGALGDAAAEEVLRLEQGVPRFGPDFGAATYPQEAGLETRAVSFDKGCYLGQEVVCMLQLRGHVKRKLVSLVLDEGTAEPGAAIANAAGEKVGELTSVAMSPSLARPVALGMVKLAAASAGTSLVIGDAKARVVESPLAGT